MRLLGQALTRTEAVLLCAAFAVTVQGCIWVFTSRYSLEVPYFRERCIPGWSVAVVDRRDRIPEVGQAYAFSARRMGPVRADGSRIGKFFTAGFLDEVEVTGEGAVLVNGTEVARGLGLSRLLQRPPGSFAGKAVLGPGEFWALGKTSASFDSRYWGRVDDGQVIGKIHFLL